MNHTPLVSVIMPVYQSENFLDISINSILNQTFKDFEIILVDNKSTDRTKIIAKEFNIKLKIRPFIATLGLSTPLEK